jgi:hypothetical protein
MMSDWVSTLLIEVLQWGHTILGGQIPLRH